MLEDQTKSSHLFMIPSTLMRFPSRNTPKHPHSIILPPLCFTVGMLNLRAVGLSLISPNRASSIHNVSAGCPQHILVWLKSVASAEEFCNSRLSKVVHSCLDSFSGVCRHIS